MKKIKDNIEAVVILDVSKSKRQLKLLGEAVKALKEKYEEKQPHVRIEFDDIRDVPDVWIDGVKIGLSNDKPLVSLNIDWETNGVALKHKQFDINYIDLDEDGGTRKSIREGSLA